MSRSIPICLWPGSWEPTTPQLLHASNTTPGYCNILDGKVWTRPLSIAIGCAGRGRNPRPLSLRLERNMSSEPCYKVPDG